jgi:hypothetical protein
MKNNYFATLKNKRMLFMSVRAKIAAAEFSKPPYNIEFIEAK